MLTNNPQRLEELRQLASKCPRCSLCKFPPLAVVRGKEQSAICPAYEEFKFHANSGGGLIVLAMSLLDGRSRITEAVRRAAYGCTACGGCDVVCKFSTDIEVQEVILQLRAKIFEEAGADPEHREILEKIRSDDHPLPGITESKGAWIEEIGMRVPRRKAPTLLWIGPHYALWRARRTTLENALALLDRAGVDFFVLGAQEPYTGRAALEIGDRALFAECARRSAAAIRASGAERVVCLSAEDYATLRSAIPRFAPIGTPIVHITELYAERIAAGKLRPAAGPPRRVAWHDPSLLGRLSEPYRPWKGRMRKVHGQMVVYEPNRPVNRGSGGCYDAPRAVLRALPGIEMREFLRKREYAFDSGEGGQALHRFPEFARNTAQRRIAEARSIGVETIVTECPQSIALLEAVGRSQTASPVSVRSLTDLLAERIFV